MCADNIALLFWRAAVLASPPLQLLSLEGSGFHPL
jgi:hypothetical protein